ncbi:DUF2510 domain-containing protein [Rathayibacter sp. ZW T2_19]|uniref:DUF2510 domain-containing protein n=1 Tax=Rathayibacter rubneri TaxID=2950106 RepID=A0A9X2IV32_9MICO|nr:phospholipid scramblase-related protein [Rathayibacter rubneri]MCM6764083.1 DUF2510 domain-containing protein [Rathayibacter rubneri]
MSAMTPAGWFPDPFGRFDHRYWDGTLWTEHVGAAGRQLVDPPVVGPPPRQVERDTAEPVREVGSTGKKVQRQVRRLGLSDDGSAGGGTLFSERILVINQKAKLFERKSEYGVFERGGRRVGGVRQFGTSMSGAVVGRENATKRLQIVDERGQPVLTLTRPATLVKSKITVRNADGSPLGQIIQENFGVLASMLGGRFNIRFRMEADGKTLGTINAESWQAWDFSIQDPGGEEIGRITKTWAGLGKERFTTADNYVLEMHRPLEDPLLSLVVSAALAVDTVLHQDGDGRRSR